MDVKSENLRSACQAALLTLRKVGNSEYAEICEKLEFVIGSFDFDKNPVGLYEFGEKAARILNELKKKNPKKVSKKVLDDLEISLKT